MRVATSIGAVDGLVSLVFCSAKWSSDELGSEMGTPKFYTIITTGNI